MSRPHCIRGVAAGFALLAFLAATHAADAPARRAYSPVLLTRFEQIWQLAETERDVRHPVRLDYVVYYYDPLWHALWGRSGEAESYLSLGNTVFPLKAGQRIRVEGTLVPSAGMTVNDPVVTVLAETAPIEVLPTRGQIGNSERFNKRMVSVEGYVDRQVARDANHLELYVITEGRTVTAQLLVRNDIRAANFTGSLIRVKGVYFARNEPSPKLELWVSGPEDITPLGPIDQDPRFALPLTATGNLAGMPPGQQVHVTGTVRAQVPGRVLTIRDNSGEVQFPTAQTRAVEFGTLVEAVGTIVRQGSATSLSDVLFRITPRSLSNIDEIYVLPEAELQDAHPFRGEMVVYYYDPYWKVMWARSGPSDNYVSLASEFPIKPGQRLLVAGTVTPAKGSVIDNAKVTVLDDSVALTVLPANGHLANSAQLNKHLVTLDGYVDRQLRTDPQHIEVDLVADDHLVSVRLLAVDDIPPLDGALLRVRGVYSATTDPAGGQPKLEVWVQDKKDLSVLGQIDRDERFNAPVTAATVASTLGPDERVHVAGVVWSQQPGHSVTIRDDTGLVTVRSVQTTRIPAGEPIEAIGTTERQGAESFVAHALYRRAREFVVRSGQEREPLRLAEQLRELSAADAEQKQVVHLTGVVTWAHPEADFFFLRDISGGALVLQPPGRKAAVIVGLKAEVWGVTAVGDFVPIVAANRVHYTATVDLPEARPVTLEQALTGVEEAQWVSMSGYVRSVGKEGLWGRLDVMTSAGEFAALLPPDARLAPLVGSVITARGVCSANTNGKRQLTGVRLWVPALAYVDIDEPVPADVFAVPLRSVASLRQFTSLPALNRRVRVAGTVVGHAPGHYLYLQDGTDGLLVLSRGGVDLKPGDQVEAVGFPGRESSRVVLRESVYRRVGGGIEPKPVDLKHITPPDPELDGRLIRVPAQLVDVSEQEKGVRLIAQAGSDIFEALLDVPRTQVAGDVQPGGRVVLTGVYVLDFDEYKRPRDARIQLRSASDIAVLERPSWWTVQRVLGLTGVLALGTIMGLAWVVALRRRVQRQTEQIREQLEKERAARVEAALARASKLESLGILAGGIAHDFNNLLTVIMCNLSLARLDSRLDPETQGCLTEGEAATTRARELTQQLLTFAKGGAPVRNSTSLPELVRESAQFALHGAKARLELEYGPDLWPADVDRGQVGQVVQNIVINANQAMPAGGTVRIQLSNVAVAPGGISPLAPGRYVKLAIADSGMGIPAEQLARIFDPYFTTKQQGSGLGLATVYSIVKQHQGHVEVESAVGKGTLFTVWLPAADRPPQVEAMTPNELPQRSGRVLFMDDEPSIRLLGGAVLRRMGLEATLVADGAAVVDEFQAARAAGRPFDLVILDLTVPGGMGGLEAMQRLREADPHVRAIVSSGYSSDPVMANHRTHGFAAVVTKPYEAAHLARTVDSVLNASDGAPLVG